MNYQRKRVAKRLASGLLAGALALGGLAISSGSVSAKTPATAALRVQGSDRYSTAVAVANKYIAANASWKPNTNIILASGENFPDALAASALAKLTNAPIILTKSNSLPSSVRDWLLTKQSDFKDSVAGKVYVVGGTSAVSADVVTDVLKAINTAADPTPHVSVRLDGTDRYATAAKINGVTGIINAADALVIVNGTNFADAVSVAPLAYKAGWPIIPVSGGAIDANGLAAVKAAVTANGGDATQVEVLIMGGTTAVPVSVEEQLAVLGFKVSNIVRIQGADRYATSLNLNAELWDEPVYGGGGVHGQSLNGAKVALASGNDFPDALAAGPWLGEAGIHLQLTNGTSLNPSAAGLLASLAQYDTAAAGQPTQLLVVGGESAVAASVVSAGVAAAQSVDVKITGMTCREEDGTTNIDMAVAEAQTAYGPTSTSFVDDLSANEKTKIAAALSFDGGSVPGLGAGAFFVDKSGNGIPDTIRVTASALTVAAGSSSTIAFAGVTEVVGASGRAFGAASCVAADDSVPPQISVVSGKGSGALTTIYLKGTEELDCSTFVPAKLSIGVTAAASGTATASALTYSPNYCKIALNATTFGGIASTTTVAVTADAVKDVSGNFNAAATSGTIGSDLAKPSLAAGASVACKATAGAVALLTSTGSNGITVSANSYTVGGAKDGVLGNTYKISIVNQRGLLLPTVVVDDTAQTITITADTAYHKAADVEANVANRGGNANWSFDESGDGTLKATAIPVLANTTSSGTQECSVKIFTSEFASAHAISSLTVNGLSLTSGTGAGTYDSSRILTEFGDASMLTFKIRPTTAVGSGSVAIAGTIDDVAGNQAPFSVVI